MTDEVRAAMNELFAAERRLRGRDPHRAGDLSATQVRALFQLERGEACTAGELAKRADLSPASMTALLDQLEQSGIVERRRSEKDRRQVIVSLTDAGHEVLAAKRARIEERTREVLGVHNDEELDAAARVMRSLVELLDSLGK
ncbi:MarR family transcriptional regulator [Solirubrobacter phytolaccae]|uniref:MarR family transcriptional regulator n=1 Tax=Solirubrobacter phytolaccae TaxID=1404360 RepID=A0A9X3NB42_9ACTN|nr:MarR family transcriptional regulator [Solirubrobacter phytolaccae]MDA0180761.1 MarR family transcriptional regulator [Solirubrobacter phytolaccae]